jgi:probable DNA metabolism protein
MANIVFKYDKTFEGMLTAVFDAYARRTFPDMLLPHNHPAPLFTTEEHNVITDPQKAIRVWGAITKKLPKQVCNMLSMGWLSEEPGVDMMLARIIRRVIDAPENIAPKIATDFADSDVLTIKQLATKVAHECEHLMQFTRFQKGKDGGNPDDPGSTASFDTPSSDTPSSPDNPGPLGPTYFAPVSPRYNVLPVVIPWFTDRFRDQRWLIYDIKRRYGFYYDLHEATEITMEDDAHLLSGVLDPSMLADDEHLFQSGWRGYIDGMAIKERINPKLQRQHMPKRFWPLLTEKQ